MASLSTHPSVVILGAGFGGMYAARHLQSLLRRYRKAHVTLIDRHNYFLMTPLLFEAGSGVLEPRHVVSPLRSLLRRVRFVQADVRGVDLDRRVVRATPAHGGEPYDVPYDQLVVALGGVTNTAAIPGADRAMTFKSLSDAIRLRNHTIQLFERADAEPDPARKRRLLTFLIAGGGLVGVELAGELAEFTRHLERSYPHVDARDVRVELVHGGDRLMPEMDESLAAYAERALSGRGVQVRTRTRVLHIDDDDDNGESPSTGSDGDHDRVRSGSFVVSLSDGDPVEAHTVVVATGVRVSPVVDAFPLAKDDRGRILTDATMRSTSHADVWALGDCAHVPGPDGQPYPQLAQHALRQAKVVARNVAAELRGGLPSPFVYRTKGTLAALGNLDGVGRIGPVRIRGFVAWIVWRTYYLFQMPRWNRRFRIGFDWSIALAFRNDIVELDVTGDRRPVPAGAPEVAESHAANGARHPLASAVASHAHDEHVQADEHPLLEPAVVAGHAL